MKESDGGNERQKEKAEKGRP